LGKQEGREGESKEKGRKRQSGQGLLETGLIVSFNVELREKRGRGMKDERNDPTADRGRMCHLERAETY